MDNNTRESVVLKFTTSLEGTHSVRVADPSPVITREMVIEAAEDVRFADPFCPENVGSLVTLCSANRVLQETDVLFCADSNA